MKQVKLVTVQETPTQYSVNGASDAQEIWKNEIATMPVFDADKEHLAVIILNTKLKAIGFNLVSIGSLDQAIAHPREIFRPVIVAGGYGFILMHNHPSGDPSPSQADNTMTRRLRDAADLMEINFLDHVIMGNDRYFSFREAGLL